MQSYPRVMDSPSRSPTRDGDHTQFSFDDSWPGRRSGVAERARTHETERPGRLMIWWRNGTNGYWDVQHFVGGATRRAYKKTSQVSISCLMYTTRIYEDEFYCCTANSYRSTAAVCDLLSIYRPSDKPSHAPKSFVLGTVIPHPQKKKTLRTAAVSPVRGEEPLVTALLEAPPCKGGISA